MGGFSSASSFFLSLLNQKNVKKIKFFLFFKYRGMGCFLPYVGNLHAVQIVSIVTVTITGEQKYISL